MWAVKLLTLQNLIPNSTISLWNMGFKRKNKKQANGIWKENIKKNLWSYKERDGPWRIKTNDELDKLLRHKNITNYIKIQRLIWFCHLHRMPEDRIVEKVYKWKPMLRRPQGRPKNRWEDDIRNDMKKLKIKNRTSCIQDCNNWKLYVEKSKILKDWSCSA